MPVGFFNLSNFLVCYCSGREDWFKQQEVVVVEGNALLFLILIFEVVEKSPESWLAECQRKGGR